MKILILLIISVTFFKSQLSSSTSVDVHAAEKSIEIQKAFQLIEEGNRQVILKNDHRDLTLILGNAGSGKTSFLQWIFGDNDILMAKELADGSFSIEDGNQRIAESSSIESKTLFPELVLNGSRAYYDCPGFSDTRSTSQDLAVAYFMKRVADHAERIRLVFTIDYSSVGPRGDKLDLKNLLSHATHLIKDVNKFSNSLALIATKVETRYKNDKDGHLIPIPDSSIIHGIGAFLKEVKNALTNDHSNAKLVQLIEDFLLKNSDDSYARIGISRLPRSAGKLSEIKEMQEGKGHIVKMLKNLAFSAKNEEDFRYSVSDRSKIDIKNIITPAIEKVNIIINNKISNLMQMTRENYKNLAQQIIKEINSVVNGLVSYVNPEPVQKLVNQLSKGHSTITRLSDKSIQVTKPLDVYEEIKLFTSIFDNHTLSQEIARIENDFRVLTFLLEVNTQVFDMPLEWTATFRAATNNMTELRNNLDNFISDITNEVKRSISFSIDIVGQWMRRHYDELIKNMKLKIEVLTNGNDELQIDPNEAHFIRNSLIQGLDALRVLINDIETLSNATVLVDKIQKCANDIKMDLSADIVKNLEKHCAHLNFLHVIRSKTMENEKVWAEQVTNTKMFLTGRRNRLKRDVNQTDTESKVANLIEIFSEKLNEYYEAQLEEVKRKMEYFTRKTAAREVDLSTANQTLLNLNIAVLIMCDTSEKINTSKTPLEFKKIINDSLFNFNISNAPLELQNIFKESVSNLIRFYKWEDLIKNISSPLDILNFTLVATNVKFQVPQSWSTPIRNQCLTSGKSATEFQETFLNQTCESVMALIKSDLLALAQQIIERYENKVTADKTDETLEILTMIEKVIVKFSDKNEKENDLLSYLKNVDNCVTQLTVDNEMIYTALKRYKYLEYMRAFNPDIIRLKPFNNNFDPVKDALKFLQEGPKWHAFILELDGRLSQYEIQSDANKYNVSNLDDWGIDNKPEGNFSVDATKFKNVLSKLNINETFGDVQIRESRLKDLENVLASNFLGTMETICDQNNNELVFLGTFIKFCDFVNNVSFQNPCGFNATTIYIFASKTLFIDRSIIGIGEQFNLSIIAPKWEFIDMIEFNLNGVDRPIDFYNKAKDGESYADPDGSDGKGAENGGAAGNLFGIGEVFVAEYKLFINANGGSGGRGQNGGNGYEGRNGTFVEKSLITDKVDTIVRFHDDNEKKLLKKITNAGFSNNCNGGNCYSDNIHSPGCNCTIYGKEGKKGGKGGKGGKRGYKGKDGKVEIIRLGEKPTEKQRYVMYSGKGLMGDPGKGGKGGPGGKSQKLQVWWKGVSTTVFTPSGITIFENKLDIKILAEPVLDSAPDGDNGDVGGD